MKTAAKICAAIACIALILAVGYVLTSKLSVTGEVKVVPAEKDAELFNRIAGDVDAGLYEGIHALGSIDSYCFVTLKAEDASFSPFKTEWITLSLDSEEGDTLVVSSNAWVPEMQSFGKLDGKDALEIKILTSSKNERRTGKLEYYIFGRYHSCPLGEE